MDSVDQNFQSETKIFCKCSEKQGSGPKCFGARIEIFGPVYNTMLHQKSMTHTHTHTHTHTAIAISLTKISLCRCASVFLRILV